MTKRSKYDELHDQYQQFLGKKAGTRYERLAALVFKALDERSVVFHDFKLVGESKVKHWIDVQIESEGKIRKTLVECKELGQDQDPVGLGIVRNFLGVITDTSPDQAIIVSTIGFTDEAKQFADHYGIRTAILRTPPKDESEGVVILTQVKINIGFNMEWYEWGLRFSNEADSDLFRTIMEHEDATRFVDPEAALYAQRGDERLQLVAFAERMKAEHAEELRREPDVFVDIAGWTLHGDAGEVPLDELLLTHRTETEWVTTGTDIAELILEESGQTLIIRDRDLRRPIDRKTREVR